MLNIDSFEVCELSTKLRAETRGHIKKINGMCRTLKLPDLLENVVIFLCKDLQRTCAINLFICPLVSALNFVESSPSSKPSTFKT